MFKNVASQKLTVFAFDATTNLPKSGDAANLTAYVSKDDGAVTVLGDTSATELDATNAKGYYIFDLTQAETNGDKLLFSAKSATANIVVIAGVVYTTPANFSTLSVDASGRVDLGKALGAAVTLDANNVLNVSAKYWAGTAVSATSIPVATAAGAAGGLPINGANTGTPTWTGGLAVSLTAAQAQTLAEYITGYKTVTWIDTTDTAKTVIEAATTGTLCILAPGTHAVGNNHIYVPDGVSVVGSGIDTTLMTVSYTAGVSFKPGSRSRISDFTLQNTAAGIPFGSDIPSGAFQNAVIERFKISSTSAIDGIYVSNGTACSAVLKDVIIESPFDHLVLAGGAHTFTLERVWINGKEASSNDTSSGIRVQNGGQLFGRNVSITLRAGTGTTDMRCLDIQDAGSVCILHDSRLALFGTASTTNLAVSNSSASIELVNCEFNRSMTSGSVTDILNPTAVAIRQEMDANSQIAVDAGQGRSSATQAALNTGSLPAMISGGAYTSAALANAPSSGGAGTGDTLVNHNTGGTDNLRFTTAAGAGIDNALITAYLKTEFDANPLTATRQAQVYTEADGRWATPMMLDHGLTYVFVFSAPGFNTVTATQAV
jgi:hypothetical protein